jgi:hypothetical protein
LAKKTALLQAEASARVSELANVLFCALAVQLIFFSHCKITAFVFLCLPVTVAALLQWRVFNAESFKPLTKIKNILMF